MVVMEETHNRAMHGATVCVVLSDKWDTGHSSWTLRTFAKEGVEKFSEPEVSELEEYMVFWT